MDNDNDFRYKAELINNFVKQCPKIYLGMINRAKKLLGLYLGFGEKYTSLAEGIMHEIFGDLIDGTRKWDVKELKLEQVLWTNIKSEVSNRVKKEKRYISTPAGKSVEYEQAEKNFDEIIVTPPDDIEGQIDAKELEDYIMNVIFKDDEDSQIILSEMLLVKKQKEIAEYLGLTVDEVEYKIRNIKRKISKNIPRYLLDNISTELKTKILKQQ